MPNIPAWAETKSQAAVFTSSPGIRFTTIPPGFVATERISEDGLPKPFQISQEQAAWHVVRALKKELAQAKFPWPKAAPVRTLRALPTPFSSLLLRKLAFP
ncbi:hypothetical protein [Streptomyces sp. NBC_01320]|uniref:hypothetical protein n=1 Tax=Streptomyces sp. NBC_01320 TaxID=2903824 RepID=UPI002E10B610|nr:hypothetical protein OG395_47580 [Streptomyces sp. NBC_01320]